jgi:sensor histidine kinase YesM
MSRKQLMLIYSLTIFMMVIGLDLISASKYGIQSVRKTVSPFEVSQLVYTTIILLLTRKTFLKYYSQRSPVRLIITVLGLIAFYILLRYALEEMLFPATIGMHNYYSGTSFGYYSLDNLYYGIILIVVGFLLFLWEQQVNAQKNQRTLLEKTREAELQFLRSQINPHFLFNTLNNIYSLVYEKSDKAPDAILKMSELMRYALYEKKERVSLSQEWSYILSLIELQKLRFANPPSVNIRTTGDLDKATIPPYLLIPFIENAFKHGDFKSTDVSLDIELTVMDSGLNFSITNPVGHIQKDTAGGIGLENVRKRLFLLFPDRHKLQTLESAGKFSVHLKLIF